MHCETKRHCHYQKCLTCLSLGVYRSLVRFPTIAEIFYSTNRLATRLSLSKDKGGEEIIVFDKDDDDALDFVCAAANLRSIVYGISSKTRWEVKGRYPWFISSPHTMTSS